MTETIIKGLKGECLDIISKIDNDIKNASPERKAMLLALRKEYDNIINIIDSCEFGIPVKEMIAQIQIRASLDQIGVITSQPIPSK